MKPSNGSDPQRARTSAVIWCSWMAAIPAGMIFCGMVADSPFVAAMRADQFFLSCWIAIQIGALLTAAAIVLGGAPLGWSVLRQAVVRRRRDILLRITLPLTLLGVLAGWIALVIVWSGGRWAPLPWAVQFSNPGWPSEAFRWLTGGITTGLLAVLFTASASAVVQILRRSGLEDVRISIPGAQLNFAPIEFASLLAPFATAGFAIMFAGMLGWGWAASRNAAFHARLGPLGLTSSSTWLISLGLFACAAAFSAGATRKLFAHPTQPVS